MTEKMGKAKAKKEDLGILKIRPPDFRAAIFTIRGNAPLVQNCFSRDAIDNIKKGQMLGDEGKSKRKKNHEPKDFDKCFQESIHRCQDGVAGFPAAAIRDGSISACKLEGYKMTHAKLSIFVIADGYDRIDGVPLVKITKGEPHYCEHVVRLPNKQPDIHARSMWDPGWEADPFVRWDGSQFSLEDVTNLLIRVGLQVGIGEGRPDSPNSSGMGWGTFDVVAVKEALKKT